MAVGFELALATASTDKELKLKHIVTALHTINQYETMHRNEFENQCSFLTKIIINLDTKSVINEKSIYAKTDCSISTSLRAYLCYALIDWLVYDINKEPVNNTLQPYINLIENLLEDALNKQTIKHWSITMEINKLENQVASSICKLNNNYFIICNIHLLLISNFYVFC